MCYSLTKKQRILLNRRLPQRVTAVIDKTLASRQIEQRRNNPQLLMHFTETMGQQLDLGNLNAAFIRQQHNINEQSLLTPAKKDSEHYELCPISGYKNEDYFTTVQLLREVQQAWQKINISVKRRLVHQIPSSCRHSSGKPIFSKMRPNELGELKRKMQSSTLKYEIQHGNKPKHQEEKDFDLQYDD